MRPSRRKGRSFRARGVTLVELMFVVALVGILTTMAFSYGIAGARTRLFDDVVQGLVTSLETARQQAMRSGARAMVNIDGQAFVAFVDADNNKQFSSGDTLLYRYPELASSNLPAGFVVTGATLAEAGTGPKTAIFDQRGFYIDGLDGVARHDANLCVQDAQSGKTSNVLLTRLGQTRTALKPCQAQPLCPLTGP